MNQRKCQSPVLLEVTVSQGETESRQIYSVCYYGEQSQIKDPISRSCLACSGNPKEASMSEAEHMMEGVSKAETEEIGRGQPLPGLPVHGKKKKKRKC